MASYEELLEATGKEYLTPTEFRILNERERSGGLEDMFMGSGKAYAGMARDLYKSNIEGDEKYDRDWNWSDAVDPAMDALSVFGFRGLKEFLKTPAAKGTAKGIGKGLQKGYNAATGARRGAATAPKVGGPKGSMPKSSGKKTLDAPDGKAPEVKPGMMQKAGTAIKNNPIKSTLAGATVLGGGAAGINAMLPDAPEGLDPLEQPAEGEVVDPAANQNLDNPNGQMAMTPEGQAQAAMQAKANSMPGMVNRQGGSGSKMANLAQGRVQAQANFMADDIIKAQKKQSDQNNFLRDRYDATGGRRAGAWDRLSEAQKDEMVGNYSKNSFYDSSSDAGKAADAKLKESGYTPPMADALSQAEGQEMAEQSRLQELDAAVEAQQSGAAGSYGVAADPENYQGSLNTVDKAAFSDKTGMRTEGTGITQNADGSFNTLEFGDTFENSGGRDSAEDYLIGQDQQGPVQPESGRIPDGQGGYSQPDPLLDPNVSAQQNQQRPFNPVEGGASMMANLDNFGPGSGSSTPNNSGKGMYTDEFGQQSELGKGTVRMSANDQEYGDANFKNKEDALGYLNRGASLEEPAPEAPAAPEAPEEEEGEEGEEGGWDKYAPYLAPLALAHPSTRNWGRKNIAKLANKFKGAKPSNMKQLEGNFYNATPIPRFPGQAPRLGNTPLQLPNRAPGLPHRAPGLPNRADPNVPAALPNKSMSAPAGRQVTPEQFRKGQAGMGRSERNAYEDSQRPEFFRKAQYFLDDL